MARNYSNVAVATTVENSGGLASGTTSLVLGSTTGMPAAPFTMRIRPETVNEELVTVTGGLGTLATPYTIVRGVDGTSAKSHPQASTIVHSVSARDFAEPQAHIDNVTPGSPHGLPVSAWQIQTVVAKTTDQGYSNDITLNDDNQLRFTADANSSYRVELNLMATGTDGNITVGWRGPTGVGGTKMVQGPNIAATNLSNTAVRITCHPFGTPVGYGLAGGTVQAYIVEKMIVTTGSNSGEVVIQHCQNTTSASATTAKAGSYLVVTKLL
jgi:hypothetical protein